MRFFLPTMALAALTFAPTDTARAAGPTPVVAEIVSFQLIAGAN